MMNRAERVEQQAAEFLWRVESAPSRAEDEALAGWLRENPRHRAAFLRLASAWKTTQMLRCLGGTTPAVNADCVLQSISFEDTPLAISSAERSLENRARMAPMLWDRIARCTRRPTLAVILCCAVLLTASAAVGLIDRSTERISGTVHGQTVATRPAPALSSDQARQVAARSATAHQDETALPSAIVADGPSRFRFESVTVLDAVSAFNQRNEVKLVIADRRVEHMRLSGAFDAERPEQFATYLARLLGVHVERENAEIRLVKNERQEHQ